MTTALRSARPKALALGRAGAALTGASAVVHVLQATSSSLAGLVMALMALACLPCAWHLWRSPTAGVWKLTALLDVTMLLLHVQVMAGSASTVPTAHLDHGGSPGGLMWTGLALAATSLSVCAVALTRRNGTTAQIFD
jgi:hypothetical protein